jgi:hypothetical protein
MAFFVQYDPATGLISGTVMTAGTPDHPNQLTLPEWTETIGKMVDTTNLVLIDPPAPTPTPTTGG